MSDWEERIREAVYESPSGERITFNYEDVSQIINKKTTGFNFPDVDGTYVQDLGSSGRRYPLRIFFWGENYDTESEAFENVLLERGIGKLEHPIYGIKNVVPFGTITRNDDLKTAANQSIIEVVFWETLELLYPLAQTDPASDVLEAVDEFNEAIANEFNDVTSLSKKLEQSAFKNKYDNFLKQVKKTLLPIADFQEDVQKAFGIITDSITNGLNILISQPITLAFQTIAMIQTPARAISNIKARLNAFGKLNIYASTNAHGNTATYSSTNAYGNQTATYSSTNAYGNQTATYSSTNAHGNQTAIDSLIAESNINLRLNAYTSLIDFIISEDNGEAAKKGYNTININEFFIKRLFLSTYVTGQIIAVVNNQFISKREALEAAETILEQLEIVEIWQDSNFESLGEIDTGASYQQLQEAVALVVRFLVEISFSLKQEIRIKIDRDRTIIDLVAELYQDLDNQFDFFIKSNNLTGSEILELPRGKEVLFYV